MQTSIVSSIRHFIAEIRSYGVGLAIADQSPRKVGIDIVALTDIKVAFRLVEAQDKQILADSTSMTDNQMSRLAKLKPGEAFLFFNRLDEPEEIITPDYRLNNKISISLSDEGISLLSSSAFFSEKILPFDAGDMECYGIALASSLFSVPFVSVKLITDIVGEKRSLADIAGTVKENIDKLYEFSLSCLCSS